jgi:hypothetical protein
MPYSWLGKDHFGIVGKDQSEVPNPPSGYIFCPHCSKVVRLPGVNSGKRVWFGKCDCGYRIVFRPEDSAIAYVDLSGILHSHGFEARSFKTYVGNSVLYPYA